MKYLDILKKYDNAIVTESKKLEDIYNQLVKEGCCEKEELDEGCNEEEGKKEPCEDGSCLKEDEDSQKDSDKTMTEFKESEDDNISEDKM